MVGKLVKALRAMGAKVSLVRPRSVSGKSRLVVHLDGAEASYQIEERRHSPYPSDVSKLAPATADKGGARPMLVAPFVSPGLGDALIAAGWSWADSAGNFDIKAPGLRLRQRLTLHRPPHQPRELPGGAGGIAIIRWLLCTAPLGERIDAKALQKAGGVSQPRVSQILRALAGLDLLAREGRSYILREVEPLLDAFVDDYGGPGGSEIPAYTLDVPNQLAARAADVLEQTLPPGSFAISADVGPDLLASWRSPTHTIVYLQETLDLDALGLVDAKDRGDANVLLRIPNDVSLFTTTQRHRDGLTLVDVPQMMWDLIDLGGEDRQEAAGRLREWFTQHR